MNGPKYDCILYMTGSLLTLTRFVLNMYGYFTSMTGKSQSITRFVLNVTIFALNRTRYEWIGPKYE